MYEKLYLKKGVCLFQGDSLSILPKLAHKVNMVLTDPPYGIGYQNSYTSTKHEKMVGDDASDYSWASAAFNLMVDDSAFFAFTGWSEYPEHFKQIENAGFKMKEPLIIQKKASGTHDLFGSFQTNSDWLLFAHKGRFTFHKTELLRNKRAGTVPNKGRKPVPEFKTRFPSCWFGKEFPYSSVNPASMKKWPVKHPTVKNVEFLKWLIQICTDPGDMILDPFCGSGSVLVAALETGRNAIGIEIEKKYCDLTLSRLHDR